jgi:hypothetical protein
MAVAEPQELQWWHAMAAVNADAGDRGPTVTVRVHARWTSARQHPQFRKSAPSAYISVIPTVGRGSGILWALLRLAVEGSVLAISELNISGWNMTAYVSVAQAKASA